MTTSEGSNSRTRAAGVIWAGSAQYSERIRSIASAENLPLDLTEIDNLQALIGLRARQPLDLVIVGLEVLQRDANLQSYLQTLLGAKGRTSGILIVPHPTPSEFLLAAEFGFMDVVDQRNMVQMLFVVRRELVALATRRRLDHLLHEYEQRFIIDKESLMTDLDVPNMEPMVRLIEQAVKTDGFELEFQPILPLKDEGIDNFEVMVRMVRGDERIPARRFLPTAERYGLISAMDRWVIRKALRRFNDEWGDTGKRKRPIRFFINVSSVSLMDTSIIGHQLSAVTRQGAPPGSVVIEVPKNVAITQLDQVKSLNVSARQFGVGFALDGYEPGDIKLNYLQHLDLQYLKVSAESLEGVVSDEAKRDRFQRILDYAHGRNLKVIASQIDDMETLAWLASSEVDFIEGFAVAEPSSELVRGLFDAPIVF